MRKEFVLRLLPLEGEQGAASDVRALASGTRVFLVPMSGFAGVEDAVVVSLDPEGAQPVGRVPGDDNNRVFTRLTRGSVATAHVQGPGHRGALDVHVRMEDFGNSGMPVDAGQVLPARPPRRTAIVSLADAPLEFQRSDVNAWVRQIAGRIGEAENRGEDMADFMREQVAEMLAFEQRLPPSSRPRLREWYAAEVAALDDSYSSAKAWLSGSGPSGGRLRRWLWAVGLVLLLIALIYESR